MYLLTGPDDSFLSAAEHEGNVVYTKKNRNGISIRCEKDDADVEQVYSANCDSFYPVGTTKVVAYDGIDAVPEKHRYDASVLTEPVVEVADSDELLTVHNAEELFFAMNRGEMVDFGVSSYDTDGTVESSTVDPETLVAFEERIVSAKNVLKAKYSS